jgi:hypothetical protein
MKSPPTQIEDDKAHEMVERFIAQNARAKAKTSAKR